MPIALAFWMSTFGVFFYIFSVDPNVPLFCEMYLKKVRTRVKSWAYMAKWNPNTPWGNYNIWRTASRNAEENARILREELNLPGD